MSDNKAIDPSDTVMAEVDNSVSIDQPRPPSEGDETDIKYARHGRKRGKQHDMDSVKNLPTYRDKWMKLPSNGELRYNGLVFYKNVDEDDEQLRKHMVTNNNKSKKQRIKEEDERQSKDAILSKNLVKDEIIKNLSDQLREKDEMIKNLSDQLMEKEAINKNLLDQLREKEAIAKDLSNKQEENMAEKDAKIEDQNKMLVTQARELTARNTSISTSTTSAERMEVLAPAITNPPSELAGTAIPQIKDLSLWAVTMASRKKFVQMRKSRDSSKGLRGCNLPANIEHQ
mgnify:CR=1 FL=1|jgi:hypothetical protein